MQNLHANPDRTLPRRLLTILLAALSALPALAAAPMPVPPKLQAAIFRKIFTHDKTLAAGNARVLVVFPDAAPGQRDEVLAAFGDNGIKANAVKLSGLGGAIGAANIVYLLPGTSSAAVEQLCAANHVLSISGLSELAEDGSVAVSVGALDGKPKIYVNLKRLRLETHELSGELLKLAKVIE